MNIFITGASRGIGRAILAELLPGADGCTVLARDVGSLENLVREIGTTFPAVATQMISSDLAKLDKLGEDLDRWSGKNEVKALDVLVINAGTYTEGKLSEIDIRSFTSDLNVNLSSAVLIVQKLLPALRLADNGRIVIVGSTAAYEDYPAVPSYGVAKWGLRSFANNLRYELRPDRIGVTFISPGGTLTGMWDGEDLPKGRLLEPSDVALLVGASLRLSRQAVVEELIVRPIEGDMHE